MFVTWEAKRPSSFPGGVIWALKSGANINVELDREIVVLAFTLEKPMIKMASLDYYWLLRCVEFV